MGGGATAVSVHTMADCAGGHIHLAPSLHSCTRRSGSITRARRSNRKGPLGSGQEDDKAKYGEYEAQCSPSADSVHELEGGGHG